MLRNRKLLKIAEPIVGIIHYRVDGDIPKHDIPQGYKAFRYVAEYGFYNDGVFHTYEKHENTVLCANAHDAIMLIGCWNDDGQIGLRKWKFTLLGIGA
jgi:hypothetical protein